MKVLLADDDRLFLHALEMSLPPYGFEPITAEDGVTALQMLTQHQAPRIAMLDWAMPGMDGTEVCRQIRARPLEEQPFLILLTARGGQDDVVTGLACGADEYLTKPVDLPELQARLAIGCRIVSLQQSLTQRVHELEEALSHVKRLRGLLPICSWCKKIRDDRNYWQQVEEYLSVHADVQFSHGICPDCMARVLEKELAPPKVPQAE
jgi:DNA-binding response OmpR family regulator